VNFGPSFDLGEGGDVGEESEKDQGEDCLKGLGDTAFGAGIADFFEALDEEFERGCSGHRNLHVGKGKTETIHITPFYERKPNIVRP
jgi:hypothetical protein